MTTEAGISATVTPETLIGWLSEPRQGRGVRIASASSEDWEYRDFSELALSARRVGSALARDGVRPGDVVCVVMPTGFDTLAAFFAAWVVGATPCLISPPSFTARDEYVERVASILTRARPRLTVTSPDLADLTAGALAAAGSPDTPWLWQQDDWAAPPAEPSGLALLQFTSGSSGVSRGVRVTWRNLASNIALIREWLDWADGDVTASWLPLYHDMGLIGCLLTPVTAQCDLWLMRPSQFIRDPMRWLRCFGVAHHTAAPPFALDYVLRRVRPDHLKGLDLSGWRNIIVGAEPIDPVVLENFAGLLAPSGFRCDAYRTAYGLAEATLAVSANAGPRTPKAVRLAPDSLNWGARVSIAEEHRVGTGALVRNSGWLVGCGSPRSGVGVTVLGEDGNELPPDHLGEIVVTGPSIADGYHRHTAASGGSSTSFRDDALHTGDAGFVHDGDLFVLGRLGDSLKVRGRSVFVEDLETRVAQATGLAKSRFAIVTLPDAGMPRVALLAEAHPGPWAATARDVLGTALGGDIDIVVVSGPKGLVERTTSGKPRRRRMAALLADGLPAGALVLAPDESTAAVAEGDVR